MDWVKKKNALTSFASKNRYVILILLLGLLLMLIPTTKRTQSNTAPNIENATTTPAIQEQLSQILSNMKGAGEVKVLLTQSHGEEIIYQTDDKDSTSTDTGTISRDTVIVTDTNRGNSGLIRQINPPVYMGAIVVCQGADNPSVRLAVVEAVSKVTGLGASKISVLKMK